MDPNLHENRRKARAEYVERTLAQLDNTVYTDAAVYPHGRERVAATVVVNKEGNPITYATAKVAGTAEAEEIAVALAAAEGYRTGRSLNILTDSKEVCRNYTRAESAKLPSEYSAEPPPPRRKSPGTN